MIPVSIFEYIILALALGIPTLITLRDCATKNPIRLTRGLGVSLLLAAEHTLILLLGILLGNMLRFDIPDYDSLVFLGLFVVVAIRMFFPAFRKKDRERVSYDIAQWGTVALLGIATGVNLLFVGLSLGFRETMEHALWRASIPSFLIVFLLGYLAIMMGRQKKELRERRWQLIAVLFLLVFAIKGAVDNF